MHGAEAAVLKQPCHQHHLVFTELNTQVMHGLLHACSSCASTFPALELAAVITACGVARFHPGVEGKLRVVVGVILK